MNWQITYRDTNGRLANKTIETNTRSEALKQAANLGIRVIRLTEVKDAPTVLKVKRIWQYVVFACVLGFVFTIIAFIIQKQPAEKSQPKEAIKKVVHAKKSQVRVKTIPTNTTIAAKEVPLGKDPPQRFGKYEVEVDKNGDRWITRDGRKRKILSVSPGTTKQLFTNRAENQLSAILTVKPGDLIIGFDVDDKKFVEEFLESLKKPIEIDENDTAEERLEKELVIEAKNNLLKYYKQGHDIVQIVKDEYREICKLNALKTDLAAEIAKLRQSGATKEEIEIQVSASNQLLKQYGVDHEFKLMRQERMVINK